MAGHSKWANIKHRKGAQDKRKGILFSKCSKAIMAAVRQGGPDPGMNLTLTYAIEKARQANMPRERIERAIQAASGGGAGQAVEEVLYEGYGPGGVAFLVESLTDNRHRTAPEMKKLFEKAGGNLAGAGAVGHLFARRARFAVPATAVDEERLLELALEWGAEDLSSEDGQWVLTGPPEAFSRVREGLREAEIEAALAGVVYLPLVRIAVADPEAASRVLKLAEALEDHDDVDAVHSNFDIPDAILERIAAASD
jgi:YebC/PmpR family DNA-binding regulatory protein